jgi:hypothetical protein
LHYKAKYQQIGKDIRFQEKSSEIFSEGGGVGNRRIGDEIKKKFNINNEVKNEEIKK